MAAKRISYDMFVEESVNEVWRRHLKERHFCKSKDFLRNRVEIGYYDQSVGQFNYSHTASTFTGTEHNIKTFLMKTMLNNETAVMDWLSEGEKDWYRITENFPKGIVGGIVFDGAFHKADHVVIYLERVGRVFRIKTAYTR